MSGLYFGGAARFHVGVHDGREIVTFKTVAFLDPELRGNVKPMEVQLQIDAGELARMLGCKALQDGKATAALPARRVVATILREYKESEHGSAAKPDQGRLLPGPARSGVARPQGDRP